MKNSFKENTGLPKFISVIFIIQFIVFIIYYLKHQEDSSLPYFIVGIAIIGLLLILTSLKLTVNKQGIVYRFHPYMLGSRTVLWSEVNKVSLIKTSEVLNMLGWGLYYTKKHGWAYITDTDNALFIILKNGKKIVLSVNNINSLKQYLLSENIILEQ